jgi:hypothetical protein
MFGNKLIHTDGRPRRAAPTVEFFDGFVFDAKQNGGSASVLKFDEYAEGVR